MTLLEHLARLVCFNTENPPRKIGDDGIVAYIKGALPGFTHELTDLGDGCVILLCTRGSPSVVFNVHLDTVPADAGWKRDPHELVVENGRAIGLGSADIKGAAACLLSAATRTRGPCALLFTTDEEAGSSACIKHFLSTQKDRFTRAIIAEPTLGQAVTAHRGIATCTGEFNGIAGHASSSRVLRDSAVHAMVRWADRALRWAEAGESRRQHGLTGQRLNLGYVEGGTKPNMIASSARVRFGVRPLPDDEPLTVMREVQALAEPDRVTWTTGFVAPPLRESEESRAIMGLPPSDAVDFWTEAALFGAAGIPAVVFGPGSIAHAHTAGESVELAQLESALSVYVRMLDGQGG